MSCVLWVPLGEMEINSSKKLYKHVREIPEQ